MQTWGAVYELSDADVEKLDRKEGHPSAYRRIEIPVEVDGEDELCMTYEVVDKQSPEIVPQPDYLADLLRGARARELPPEYVSFLEALEGRADEPFRDGFLVLPTHDIRNRSIGVLQVNRHDRSALGLGRVAVVQVGELRACVEVGVDPALPDGACRLDQNVRNAIGIPGQFTFGSTARLLPHAEFVWPWRVVRPRFLLLPVAAPARLDSEKDIAVLHPMNIRLLGISEGDYIRVRSIQPDGDKFRRRAVTLRVFSGAVKDSEIGRPESEREYPAQTEIYLDADTRRELGMKPRDRGTPVHVTADVRKLLSSRLLLYGVVYLVGLAGIAELTRVAMDLARGTPPSDTAVYASALVVAIVITAGLAIVDIRSRVQS